MTTCENIPVTIQRGRSRRNKEIWRYQEHPAFDNPLRIHALFNLLIDDKRASQRPPRRTGGGDSPARLPLLCPGGAADFRPGVRRALSGTAGDRKTISGPG